ncbi:30S ribosomal protein S11 (modular protein) [groundwater metagenome]|uniref:30S ribosomal protein S11 (Modular protein) n=1 Tax=groundwater metagenome TaxID=717931 RepID=A0A098E7U2_9ZZZZ
MSENINKDKEINVNTENPANSLSAEQTAKEQITKENEKNTGNVSASAQTATDETKTKVTEEVKPSEKKIEMIGGVEKKGLWGVLHIYSSPNNAIYQVTDLSNSETIVTKYGKQMVTADKDKPTPYAAMKAMGKIVEILREKGIAGVDVVVRGPGGHTGPWFPGKAAQAAIKQLVRLNFPIGKISDNTPIAHGGCTPKKTKRKK